MEKRKVTFAIPKRVVQCSNESPESRMSLEAARRFLCQQTPDQGVHFLTHLNVCSSCSAKWPNALELVITAAAKNPIEVALLADYLRQRMKR